MSTALCIFSTGIQTSLLAVSIKNPNNVSKVIPQKVFSMDTGKDISLQTAMN